MTSSDFFFLCADVNRFSAVAGILYFLFFIRKWKSVEAIIFYVLFISFAFDFGIYIYIKYYYPNSYYGSNWWIILNYGLMSWLFLKVLPEKKRLIQLGLIGFYVSAIITFTFFYSFAESNTITRTFSSIVMILFSLLGFSKLLKMPDGNLFKVPVFYLLSAFLFYYGLTFFKGLFLQYLVFELQVNANEFFPVAILNLFANTSKNFILFYVLVLMDKKLKDPIISNHHQGKA
ncbi:MAG: hypothetical protein AAF391_08885 [Bacteroidota bacterium]